MKPTEEELKKIVSDWESFAQTKVFAFRGISAAAYALFAPAYFKAIIDRSKVYVMRDDGRLVACVIFEEVPDSETTIVHWAWTDMKDRNQGWQDLLWEKTGLSDRHIFISHLTVLSERMCAKYGWLFNPFTLYKEATNEDRKGETEAGDDKPAERTDLHVG